MYGLLIVLFLFIRFGMRFTVVLFILCGLFDYFYGCCSLDFCLFLSVLVAIASVRFLCLF